MFFPRITLEDKAGSEWEPYIFGAVCSARVMLVVGTEADSFEDIWVRNTWSRFIIGGSEGKAVIPLLYGASPDVLPVELARFQATDASALGFEQDLIQRIKSLISGKADEAETTERNPLVRRAYIFLEDGDHASAENMCRRFEQSLPAEAALVRLLIEYGLNSEDALGGLSADIMKSENYRIAMQTGDEALRARLKKHALSAQYNLFKNSLQSASDETACLSAANGFYQLGDYKDSADMAALAKEKAAKLGAKSIQTGFEDLSGDVYSAKIKPIRKRFFTPLRIGLLAGGVCAAALVAVVICNSGMKPVSDIVSSESVYSDEQAKLYERATELFNEGGYAEAETVFASLGNYQKSSYMAKECRYKQAEQLFADGEVKRAREIFSGLGNHGNSLNMLKECDYAIAVELEKQGELKSAAEAFEALGVFSDSKARKNRCLYQLALESFECGDFDYAEEIMESLGYYEDSPQQLCKIKYAHAERYFTAGNYTAAYELFSSLGDYSDSAERASESQYQRANLLLEARDYSGARKLLEQLGDYMDSEELISASWLSTAVEKLDEWDKRGAYEVLTSYVNEYAPAQPYLSSMRCELLNGEGWSPFFYMGRWYGNYYVLDENLKDKVSWHVLKRSGDMVLIVSNNALDYLPFDENGSSSWADSSLRAWLNGEFCDSVFTDAEKQRIVSTTNGGVTDRIFLLNLDEAVRLYSSTVYAERYYATFYTQGKIPKDITEVYSWGRDGLLAQKPTETGFERLTASPTEPQLIFPAMWIRIE